MSKELAPFYLHGFFKEFVLLYPVYMLMFEAKGLSMMEITLLLMIWSLPVFVLEMPSGMLADIWSKKKLIVLGTALKLAGFTLWLFAQDFMLFAAGFVCWGIQEAFCSGSTEALLYDTLCTHHRESGYEKYAGRFRFCGGIAIAAAMVLGGFAAESGFETAGILSIASIGGALLFALLLKDSKKEISDGNNLRQYFRDLKKGFALFKKSSGLIMALALCTAIVVVPGVLEEFDQAYAKRIGLPMGWVGVWGAARIGMESLGSWFAHSVKKWIGTFNGICLLAAAAGLLLYAAACFFTPSMFPLYGVFYMLLSCGYILAEGRLQRKTDPSQRATVLSMNSLLINVVSLVIVAGFGGVCEYWSLQIGFLAMAVLTVVMVLVLALVNKVGSKRESKV